jgi:hypothetical protein
MGQQATRNKLIELAQGKNITSVDADDELFPNALEVLPAMMRAHGPESYVLAAGGTTDASREHAKLTSCLRGGNLLDGLHSGLHHAV